MKTRLLYMVSAVVLMFFAGCAGGGGTLLPNSSGAAFEVLLVIDDDVYRTPAGEAVFNALTGPVPHLPQPEAQFRISRVPHKMFDHLLRTTRNIVFVTVDSMQYTRCTVNLLRDRWARMQAIVNITAPDTETLLGGVEQSAGRIVDFLVRGERERFMDYYASSVSQEAVQRVYKKFGCKIALPTSMNKFKEGEDFLWVSNGSGNIRQDILIYSLPYRSAEQLTREGILAARDSVLKKNLPGGVEGSYMGTEYRYYPPETEEITVNGAWCAETRGLWRMVDGEIMGGPFVSHTRIDEVNGRIIVAEGFAFAPRVDKRTPLRQVEAMVYTLKLPQEINAVTVVAKRPETKESAE